MRIAYKIVIVRIIDGPYKCIRDVRVINVLLYNYILERDFLYGTTVEIHIFFILFDINNHSNNKR